MKPDWGDQEHDWSGNSVRDFVTNKYTRQIELYHCKHMIVTILQRDCSRFGITFNYLPDTDILVIILSNLARSCVCAYIIKYAFTIDRDRECKCGVCRPEGGITRWQELWLHNYMYHISHFDVLILSILIILSCAGI